MNQITFKDITIDDYHISLSKLFEKQIKDIEAYLSTEYGQTSVCLFRVVFEDGSSVAIEGEHDFPYVTEYRRESQPNFKDKTLNRLYKEMLEKE